LEKVNEFLKNKGIHVKNYLSGETIQFSTEAFDYGNMITLNYTDGECHKLTIIKVLKQGTIAKTIMI
jgi:hypothetical protein